MKTRIEETEDTYGSAVYSVQTMKRLDTGDCVWGTIKLTRDFSEEFGDNNYLDGKLMQFYKLCDAVESQELLEEWASLSDVEVI